MTKSKIGQVPQKRTTYGTIGFNDDGVNLVTSKPVVISNVLSANSAVFSGVIASKNLSSNMINDIGIPGALGFGVGICDPSLLPLGFTELSGTWNVYHYNYGNYQYSDGSIMCWIPKFYYKIGTGSNGLTINTVDIKGVKDFATTVIANDAGYALHRAFIDGGVEQPGFFIDKHTCSKNARGTGFVASSVKNGNPITPSTDHNPIADITSVSSGNICASIIQAAKGRSDLNGVYSDSSIFHCSSKFQYAALALLSLAHGNAVASTTNCAYWLSGKSYPKGNNNSSLRDTDDTTLLYVSDGYSNCGKAGSGSLFAKTTHNGQDCGVADLNGNVWELSLGMTCVSASKTITGASQALTCVITIANHGYTTGDIVLITSVVGMTQLNDKLYTITAIDANTFSLNGVDSSAYTAYTSGGSCTKGAFYTAKESTRMKDFTSGNTLITDHWGATGIANMMESFTPPFLAASGGSAVIQRMGSGTNQVLAEGVSGADRLLTGLGLPKSNIALSTTGIDLFGKDQVYQYIRNEMCLLSCGYWGSTSSAGIWTINFNYFRTSTSNQISFRSACYIA